MGRTYPWASLSLSDPLLIKGPSPPNVFKDTYNSARFNTFR
jgi:hypothetical protein